MNGRIPGQFGMERNPDLIPIPHASGFAIDLRQDFHARAHRFDGGRTDKDQRKRADPLYIRCF